VTQGWDFDDASFAAKTQHMIAIMYAAKGVGLAAPQIGLNENLFVYNPSGDAEYKAMERVVCNPTITEYSSSVEVEEEACLSMLPDDIAGHVARAAWIQVQYQNEMGQQVRRRLKGFEARVFQHEYDHLKGILCYDRFPPQDREAAQENVDKLMGLYTESDAQPYPDPETLHKLQPAPLSQMPSLDSFTCAARADASQKEIKKEPMVVAKAGFGGGNAKKAPSKKKKRRK
jgi:peptide deformylase